ncbi:MAG: hypothetical protein VB858_09790 [Planctomycetaceae bacterium]
MSDSKKHEDLVAYLDGELNDQAAANVEKTLAADAGARQNVENMTRTWELLDLLPEVRTSQNFTEKTLTVIQAKATASLTADSAENVHNDVYHGRMRERTMTVARRAGGFLVLLLIASLGFHSTFQSDPVPRKKLLQELSIAKRLDEYQEAGDIEFLKALHESGLFHDKHSKTDVRQR